MTIADLRDDLAEIMAALRRINPRLYGKRVRRIYADFTYAGEDLGSGMPPGGPWGRGQARSTDSACLPRAGPGREVSRTKAGGQALASSMVAEGLRRPSCRSVVGKMRNAMGRPVAST